VNASDADGFRQCLICGMEFAGTRKMTRCSNCQASRAESITVIRGRLDPESQPSCEPRPGRIGSASAALGFLRLPSVVTTVGNMTPPPNASAIPLPGGRPGFRVVVKARTSGARAYVWEIVHEDGYTERLVSQSSGSFRSMEEAYADGSIALALARAPA
jgi:hypothetical protein